LEVVWSLSKKHSISVHRGSNWHVKEVLKMSLALHEPKQVARQSNSNTTSEHAPQVEWKEIIDFVCRQSQ
jgi:hypothetical protein